MIQTGIVKFYGDGDRRYGFIVPDGGGPDLFFSERGLFDYCMIPQKGQRVSYFTAVDNTGRACAKAVRSA